MWNYLLRLIFITCAISCTGCAPPIWKADQMLKSETARKLTNVDTRHDTEVSTNEGVTYKTGGVSSQSFVPAKPKVSRKLKPVTAEKREIFERKHQRALSSDPELHRTWSEIHDNSYSECQWLLRKIFPKKSLSEVLGKAAEVTLTYKHFKDENNEPFPQMKVAALLCRFPEKCKHGTRTTFIRSPDPNCAFYMNRQSSKSAAYFIAEEICKSNTYFRFWDSVLDGERRPGKHLNPLYYPGTSCQQEEYERKHILYYLGPSVKYQVCPELKKEAIQIYCHMIFEKYLPGEMMSISDIKSKYMPIELTYKRIKDASDNYYSSQEVCAFFCDIPQKFHVSSFQFIRSPNLSCVYLIRKRHSSSTDYLISREICDQKWNMKNLYPNTEQVVDISDKV